MVATAFVNIGEESGGVRELRRVLGADPLQDSLNLEVLPPLEHRRGDEEAEQRGAISCPEGVRIHREGADSVRIAEYRRDAWVVWCPEVVIQVPAHDRRRDPDLAGRGAGWFGASRCGGAN